jgi:hypothetical protein
VSNPVVVRLYTGVTAASFATEKPTNGQNGQSVSDVPGFQDEAFSTSTTDAHGIVINLLAARKGSLEILVVAQASVEAEKTLEQQIFAHL